MTDTYTNRAESIDSMQLVTRIIYVPFFALFQTLERLCCIFTVYSHHELTKFLIISPYKKLACCNTCQ